MKLWNFNTKAKVFMEGFKKDFFKNPFGISFSIIGIFGILFLFSYLTVKYYERRINSRYTVGTTIEVRVAGSAGREVEYSYSVNKKEYRGFRNFSYGQSVIVSGGKYFVLYSSKNPENSEMYLMLVPDSIQIPPEDGWEEFPIKSK